MEKEKKNGRPKTDTSRQKCRIVSTRLTAEEFIVVSQRAKVAGVKISRYMREALLKGKVVQRMKPEEAKVMRLLANEVNNINQLAHKANAEGYKAMAEVNAVLAIKLYCIIEQLSDDWKDNKRK